MSAERELLRRLRATLAEAEVDVDTLVVQAWDEARREVQETLRRLMVGDLLERSLRALGRPGDVPVPAAPAGEAAQASDADLDPSAAPAATYLYGVIPADAPLPEGLPQLPGGGPVRTVDLGGLRALVCRLEQETLDCMQAPGRDGLDTLAAVAQGHDATLAAVARESTVLPLRLGTVVADESAVRALLARHADALGAELDRLGGYAEWAVTVHLVEPFSDQQPADTAGTSGRDYLHRRQASLRSRQHRRDARHRLADEIHGRLAACAAATEVVANKPMGDVAPPLLHGVYLLDREQRGRFAAVVDELRAVHAAARVDLSGPWPPYHFSSVRVGDDVGTAP